MFSKGSILQEVHFRARATNGVGSLFIVAFGSDMGLAENHHTKVQSMTTNILTMPRIVHSSVFQSYAGRVCQPEI